MAFSKLTHTRQHTNKTQWIIELMKFDDPITSTPNGYMAMTTIATTITITIAITTVYKWCDAMRCGMVCIWIVSSYHFYILITKHHSDLSFIFFHWPHFSKHTHTWMPSPPTNSYNQNSHKQLIFDFFFFIFLFIYLFAYLYDKCWRSAIHPRYEIVN